MLCENIKWLLIPVSELLFFKGTLNTHFATQSGLLAISFPHTVHCKVHNFTVLEWNSRLKPYLLVLDLASS